MHWGIGIDFLQVFKVGLVEFQGKIRPAFVQDQTTLVSLV